MPWDWGRLHGKPCWSHSRDCQWAFSDVVSNHSEANGAVNLHISLSTRLLLWASDVFLLYGEIRLRISEQIILLRSIELPLGLRHPGPEPCLSKQLKS